MVERHHAYGYNVWREGKDVKIDFFFSDLDPRAVTRDDADLGVKMTREHAVWLADHLIRAIGDEEQVEEFRKGLDFPRE